ncbi:MAG: DUF2190 family protein [Rhodoblastus sp.]
MSNPATLKTFFAAGVVAAKSFVKATANRWECAQASAATDKIVGPSDLGAVSVGDAVDVPVDGVAEVTCGAVAIAAGDPITSDANGLAVTAAKVVGQTVHVAGFALVPAAPGDIFPFQVSPSVIVG